MGSSAKYVVTPLLRVGRQRHTRSQGVQQPARDRRYATMSDASGSHAEACHQIGSSVRQTSDLVHRAMVVCVAFILYWLSSYILEARKATLHFGADTWLYSDLAQHDVVERIPSTPHLERIVRFHPLTVAMAIVWMKSLNFLNLWIAPLHLLKAMFSAIGAAGVWAAMSAFAAVVPRRHVLFFGILYAVSFGVWFFSSVEESKIISTSLSAFYIAVYLRLREEWTTRGAVVLTAILLLACLNEMVAIFLVIIPIIDLLVRRGLDWRHGWWIGVHGLAGPVAFLIVEGILYRHLPAATNPEGPSHFGMLVFYLSRNIRNAEMLYSFAVNWLFFNLAAPTAYAPHWVPPGFFQPVLANYFSSPVSGALVGLFGVMIAASVMPRFRAEGANPSTAILLAFLSYTLIRGVFFFLFDPAEPLLFSSSATLPHMLLIGIPFATSKFPAKGVLLGALAVLLSLNNASFIVGW